MATAVTALHIHTTGFLASKPLFPICNNSDLLRGQIDGLGYFVGMSFFLHVYPLKMENRRGRQQEEADPVQPLSERSAG